MHPRRPNSAAGPGNESNPPLLAQLAKSLKPEARQALMHGVRRRILRTFNQDPTPRTTQDLLKTFPGLSLSCVAYHVFVLDECGSLAVSRVKETPGSPIRLLTSKVADDQQLLAVLRATESLDDVR